jgi:hypothetical protein
MCNGMSAELMVTEENPPIVSCDGPSRFRILRSPERWRPFVCV